MSESETSSPLVPAQVEPPPENVPAPPADPDAEAERIIRSHVLWSIGGGAVPVPLFDVAAVTAVQMDALKQLASIYGIDYSESAGKRFVTALAGGTAARLGASLIKIVPGVGTALGSLSMMALSGASTYAVCQVAVNHFKTHGNFLDLDLDVARKAYREALEKGKEVVKKFEGKGKEAQEKVRLLRELEDLRDAGVLSESEFEAKKSEIFEDR